MKKNRKAAVAGLIAACAGFVLLVVILILILRSRGCTPRKDAPEESAADAFREEVMPEPEEPEPAPTEPPAPTESPAPTDTPNPELPEETEDRPDPAGKAEGLEAALADYAGREGFLTGDDWLFYTEENGELTLSGAKHPAEWVCMVPDRLSRRTVSVIGPDCIVGTDGAVILLPETVRSVESWALSGKGFSIYIPPATVQIAEDAFAGCGSFRIFCRPGSTAQRYAEDHGIPYLTDAEAIVAAYTVPDDSYPRPYFLARQAFEKKDYATVVELLRPVASEQNPHAAYLLAECYASGLGITRNSDEAYRLFRIGADAGLGRSEGNVGRCLVQGSGTGKDPEEGVRWLKLAADQNNSLSYLWLGYCYHKGEGVAKDLDRAEELYQRALDNGESYAQTRLSQLEAERKKH